MEENLGDLLITGGDLILDSLIENELIKEIPVIGTSLKIIGAVRSVRDNAYLNKIRTFLNQVGEISEDQKQRLISESKKSKKNRVKFGNALYSSLEQSDSQVKIQYIGIAFEAFLNKDIEEHDLRMICHIINNTFVDELIDVIENDLPEVNLKYVVSSGLAESHFVPRTMHGNSGQPFYELSEYGKKLKEAWKKYGKV
jgi:hypothetical protein